MNSVSKSGGEAKKPVVLDRMKAPVEGRSEKKPKISMECIEKLPQYEQMNNKEQQAYS